jgi:hypothetical protein
MTTANGTAPHIDATQLATARRRTFTAVKKALAALEETAAQDMTELGNGDVPPAAALRKAADKYLGLLADLDRMDALLTPEALEAVHLEHGEPDGQVTVAREDLALLTGVIAGLHPEVPADGSTPLGRLTAAADAGRLSPEQLAQITVQGG